MRLLSFLLLLTLLFSGCEDKPVETPSSLSPITFALEGYDKTPYTVTKQGRNVTLKEAEGKVLVLDIFGSWCPACKVVAPHLSNIQKQFEGKVQVMGIMIDSNKPHTVAKEFATRYGASYPITNTPENHKLAGRIAADMQQPRSYPIPLMVMYDQQGNYYRHYIGAVPEEMIARDIQNLLEK